jgi:hypothetical protein
MRFSDTGHRYLSFYRNFVRPYTRRISPHRLHAERTGLMSDPFQSPVRRRIKGGFRQLVETELGDEQVCGACRESWPTDDEFFIVTETSMAYVCKACTADRRPTRHTMDNNFTRVHEQLTRICFAFFHEKNKKTPYVQI